MKTHIAFLLILLCPWFALAQVSGEAPAVSLVQLIANPKDYDGKVVRVIGFVNLEFEGNAIYLNQESAANNITKNGLWLDITQDILEKHDKLNQKYLLIQGTFNAKMTGHMGLWSGSIQKITVILPVPKRDKSNVNQHDSPKSN